MMFVGKKSKEKAVQLASQVKSIRDGTCHTCLQPWQKEESKVEEQRLLAELSECKIDIEASVFATKETEEFKTALVGLNERVNAEIVAINQQTVLATADLIEQAKPQVGPTLTLLKAACIDLVKQKTVEFLKEDAHKTEQNHKNQKLMEAFFLAQKELSDKHHISLDSVFKELSENKNQYEQSAQALASHLIALNRYKTGLDSLKSKEDDINSKVVHMNQKVVELSEKLEIAEEVKRCLKSYLSCSFDDALDSISETATRILRAVPTMANASVRLQGTKEMGSGSIKEQVNALLDNDGEINIKSLSGGERSALDLAIDLAVCEMIQEKANKGIDIMVLDEPFGGFDSIGVEHALEMLKTLDKRILIVEHNPVAKEFIDCRITVIRDGETSYIK
jgi:DNA repair exonuclease SbcCD ATPase subunit